ncbi:hypothetical protein PENSUB_4321 [Penicillium subrubescens]|uniref:Uncharacterized protein n=1 Tax=Penicillium subrubescens TaxID=1316194 RepID=A0A1Q5UAI3_9EURO|nr:hypothetical protein PENSUB_5161 [Penicillium subrubescens]OKP09491.1 hypothetical protein PENSUB_5159 [Penicillium subrubescens]OKP09518.1 hypothetical protein PENSUB_5140 [Penicillium subrubescens]OKP10275.1 hypothetical protein PENSUB_4321 [Penicillium subrubescens]
MNGILASRDAPFSNTEQQSIGDPAIADWETEDEEGIDPKSHPEVITTLFERKAPDSPSHPKLLLTLSLLKSKEKGQTFDNSPSVVRRTMIAEEDKYSCEGSIRQDMLQERKQNANLYFQGGKNWPRELHNYSDLKATRLELPANSQGSKFN